MEENQNQQQGYGNTSDNNQQQTDGNEQTTGNTGNYGNEQTTGNTGTYGNQQTYGNAGNYGNEQTYGNTGTYGNQQTYGNAGNYGNQQTYGNQQSYGNQQTYGNQQSYGNQQNYGNTGNYGSQQTYGNQQNYSQQYDNPPIYYNNGSFTTPQPVHGPVTDVFCYILLVLMPLRQILGMISSANVFKSVDLSYSSIMNDSYMAGVYTPGYMVMTILSYVLTIAFIVFIVLDIVKIYKQHYKITGLVLFAIFLTPGYYIWRAHILGRKKTFPVIYTVCYSLLVLGSVVYTMYQAMDMYMEVLYLLM